MAKIAAEALPEIQPLESVPEYAKLSARVRELKDRLIAARERLAEIDSKLASPTNAWKPADLLTADQLPDLDAAPEDSRENLERQRRAVEANAHACEVALAQGKEQLGRLARELAPQVAHAAAERYAALLTEGKALLLKLAEIGDKVDALSRHVTSTGLKPVAVFGADVTSTSDYRAATLVELILASRALARR